MTKIRQFQVTLACTLGNFLIGLLFVWPSYTLNLYTSKNTTLLSKPMTEIEGSLLGSLPCLGALFGTVLSGIIINGFGRKIGGIAIAMPYIASWLMIDLSSSAIVVLIARFLAGISCGATVVHAPIFISEVADESVRGLLASAIAFFYCFGVLVSYIFGWVLTFRYIVWMNILFCILYVALLLSIMESPVFLLKKRGPEAARESIAYYKGLSSNSKEVTDALARLKQEIMPAVELIAICDTDELEKEKLNDDNGVEQEKMPPYKILFLSPAPRRGFIIVALTVSVQILMGMVAVQVYAKTIFAQAAPNLSPHLCSVLFALVLFSGSLFCGFLSDRFGRKILATQHVLRMSRLEAKHVSNCLKTNIGGINTKENSNHLNNMERVEEDES
ncbi:facilitated trehalose transporter Tret1-like isoform X2 [Leptidea sinapis]|uniref:facilitated trehalose transporter Tret1-like isoform X2 n=1 Tax=Leptidea sinapis TaxID=189913 RepID=UPI0021C28CE9|nr:facilitated trehalose transporter Tret1-like isoform X2 [Leptidea sinapis]